MKTKAELIELLRTFINVKPSGLSDWKIEARKAVSATVKFPNATCAECGLPYEEFPIDMVLPLDQWKLISPTPDGSGVLCAGCIVLRASRLPKIIVAKTELEFA